MTVSEGVEQVASSTGPSTGTDEVILEYESGIYEGEVFNGFPHGQGTFTFTDGGNYAGGWKEGVYHGQGTAIFPDGSNYVGEWKDGAPWNGTYSDGDQNVIGTYSDGAWKEN